MRISDWSSDVCSSDLSIEGPDRSAGRACNYDIGHLRNSPFRGQAGRSELTRCAACRSARRVGGHARSMVNLRSEEHTSELPSLMRISYAVFCLKKKRQRLHSPHKTATINTHTKTRI